MRNKTFIKRVGALILIFTLVLAFSSLVFASPSTNVDGGGVTKADTAIAKLSRTGTFAAASAIGLLFGFRLTKDLFAWASGGGGGGGNSGVSLWKIAKNLIIVIVCLVSIFIAYNWSDFKTKAAGQGTKIIDNIGTSVNELVQ